MSTTYSTDDLAKAAGRDPEHLRGSVRAGLLRPDVVEGGEPRWSHRAFAAALSKLRPVPATGPALSEAFQQLDAAVRGMVSNAVPEGDAHAQV